MDPDETLKQAREAYEKGDMEEAAYLYMQLDAWLARGGFLPRNWKQEKTMRIADDFRIGTATGGGYAGTVRVTVIIRNADSDNRELSITGEVGPPSDPVSAGQVQSALPHITRYRKGWNAAKVQRLTEIWQSWHLNAYYGKKLPDSIVTELQEMFA
jgi:hypothetical protein